MKNPNAALARIKIDLSKLVAAAPALAHANGSGRIYELYLMMRLALKLKHASWGVIPLDHTGNPLGGGTFIQRGGAPAGIVPSTAASGPSSIQVQHPRTRNAYEILNGIQFTGRSSALHEIDIAVVPKLIADSLRAGASVGYPVGRPCIAIECKDVGASGSSDEMRSVIARMYDLTILSGHRPHLFGGGLPSGSIFAGAPSGPWIHHGKSPDTYLRQNQRSLCVLARRTGITSGAYKMTGLFQVRTYTQVDRGTQSANELIDDTIAWMDSKL